MARGEDVQPAVPVELPGAEAGPLRKIGRRLVVAVTLICLVAALAYVERDGYTDPEDGEISLLDAFYYSTVSVTTTGYGDIRPTTDSARVVTTLLVAPARVLFLILLVGTTLEILAERTRTAYPVNRWRSRLKDHIIVCGYGTKGRTAIRTLLSSALRRSRSWSSIREPTRASGLGRLASPAWPEALSPRRCSTKRGCARRGL